MKNEHVDILLATYQGEKYLDEQIKSIFKQTHQHFHLIIRDDGSKDRTSSLLEKWTNTHPDKITVIKDSKGNLGVIANFSELLQYAKAEYVLLSDQDDYWLPQKIEKTLALMKKMEAKHGRSTPLLAHTNLTVVDRDLNILDPSFWNYANLKSHYNRPNHLLVQNAFAGCTMLANRSLLDLLYPLPEGIIIHDWWMALVASSIGKLEHLEEPTILYRQHGGNTLGAQKYSFWNYLKRFRQKPPPGPILTTEKQANHLLTRYGHLMDLQTRKMVEDYTKMKQSSYFHQRWLMFKHRFWKHSPVSNIERFIYPFNF